MLLWAVNSNELLELMSALTGDRMFEEAYNEMREKGDMTMKTWIDYKREIWENEGFIKGQSKGFVDGERKGFVDGENKGSRNRLIKNLQTTMRKMNLDEEQAMDFLDVTEEERKDLRPHLTC